MRKILLIALILKIFYAGDAIAQPRRTLLDAGPAGQVTAAPQGQGEALRLTRQGQTLWQTRTQRFEPFANGAPIAIAPGEVATGITGWTGGAYCCWTLQLFRADAGALRHIAALPLGKRDPSEIRLAPPGSAAAILLADAAFDFWEAPISRATDLHPTIPFRWTGRRLEPDVAAMRRPVAAALGTACVEMAAPADRPPPEQRVTIYPDIATAIARLRDADWSAPRGTHPGVEAARLATCLVYSGHAADAQRLLREAWPSAAPGLPETERQLTARLACSPFVAAVRAANAPGAPFLNGRCAPEGADQTALYRLGWR